MEDFVEVVIAIGITMILALLVTVLIVAGIKALDSPAHRPDDPEVIYADRGIEIRKVCFPHSGLFMVVGSKAVAVERMQEPEFNLFCGE